MAVMARSLTADEIIHGYLGGAFPMDVDGALDLFVSDPRAVIPLDRFRVPRSVRRALRDRPFTVAMDTRFAEVIAACGGERHGGAWLTPRLADRYGELFERGFAHSVEVMRGDDLVGGLFGVALGGLFTSESMFHRVSDAGSAALVATHAHLVDRGYALWDIQMRSDHTARFGAVELPHEEYRDRLAGVLRRPCTFI